MIGTVLLGLFAAASLFNFTKPRKLIYIQIFYMFIVGYLIYDLGAPRLAFYLGDLNTAILLLHMVYSTKHKGFLMKKAFWTWRAIGLFLLVCVISAGVNFSGFSSILMFIWGLRNYFRFFVFFSACISYTKKEDVSKIFRLCFYMLLINTVLSFYQYFVQGYINDYVGGTFGTETGCNAYSNLFFIIMCSYYLCSYIKKKTTIFYVALVFGCCLSCATLAELKFFFIEFAIIICMGIIFNKPNLKTVILAVLAIFVLSTAISFFQTFYKEFDFFNWDSITYYSTETSYSYSSDSINRMNGIEMVQRMFLPNISDQIFGVGVGNADYSFFFASRLYRLYGNTHYNWFLHTYLFLETGWVGLISYVLIFVGIFIDAFLVGLKNKATIVFRSTQMLAILAVLTLAYNSSLRMDAAYIFFGILAIPFTASDTVQDNEIFLRRKRIHFKI